MKLLLVTGTVLIGMMVLGKCSSLSQFNDGSDCTGDNEVSFADTALSNTAAAVTILVGSERMNAHWARVHEEERLRPAKHTRDSIAIHKVEAQFVHGFNGLVDMGKNNLTPK